MVDMDQTATKKSLDFGHLPVANSKGEPDFRSFLHWRCGPVLTQIGAYEIKISNFFSMAVPEKTVSGFLFSVRKQKPLQKSNIIVTLWYGHSRKDREKHPESRAYAHRLGGPLSSRPPWAPMAPSPRSYKAAAPKGPGLFVFCFLN